MRSQAHIEKIVSVNPIPGADRIEVIQVLGWECIALKGEFKVGDFCVYIEIDSIVPPEPEFEFLEERKYRVRTIKMRGQISQGLALPITGNIEQKLQSVSLKEGTDVSELLDVKKFDPQIRAEKRNRAQKKKRSWLMRFLMRRAWFRFLYFRLFPPKTKGFPTWIPKTDETRVQARPSYLVHTKGKTYYLTEKLDGQSVTVYYKPSEKSKSRYGVCSRNVGLDPDAKGNWQDVARKHDLKTKLQADSLLEKYPDGISIQGEVLAPGVQGNSYRVEEPTLYVFNVYDNDKGKYVSLKEMQDICSVLGLDTVPVLNENFDLSKYDLKSLLKFAEGKSVLKGREDVNREGLVIRTHDQLTSFKAISNLFLLKKVDIVDDDGTDEE